MIQGIIGVLILIIVILVSLRVLGNVMLGLVMIAVVFVASYLILGSLPELQSIPVIGKYLPEFSSTTGEAIAVVRNVFYSLKILDVAKDAESNLLVTIVNTGKLELSGFEVFIDEQEAQVINSSEDPLESGHATVLQIGWTEEYSKVVVQTERTSAIFEK